MVNLITTLLFDYLFVNKLATQQFTYIMECIAFNFNVIIIASLATRNEKYSLMTNFIYIDKTFLVRYMFVRALTLNNPKKYNLAL